MPSFGLFRKQKNPDQPEQTAENMPEPETETEQTETAPETPVEETQHNETEAAPESPVTVESEVAVAPPEPDVSAQQVSCKAYLKAMPLRDLSDIEGIKTEVQNGNILILRITPLASKSIESVKSAVNELYSFTESIGGDIARLGEERVVICPKNIRIWREKAPIKNEAASTAA